MFRKLIRALMLFLSLIAIENMAKVEKVIIIGSGPAGLTAAIYAARANLQPIIFEGKTPGGQLTETSIVENWPGEIGILGPDLMQNMEEQAIALGAEILPLLVTNVNFSQHPFLVQTDDGQIFKSHSIIIATGATPKRLHCLGEKTYWGKGISTCAVCDGALYKNKSVLIIGGGDSAMEYAAFLKKFTDNITIVHRGNSLSASHVMQERIINDPNIQIIYNSVVSEFIGNEQKLTHVLITNQKTKKREKFEIDGVFIAIGAKPNTDLFKGKLILDKNGYIKVHDNVKTSVPGVFAAGDVHDFEYRQAITSAADGAKAALKAEKYLEKREIRKKHIKKGTQNCKEIKQYKNQKQNVKKRRLEKQYFCEEICC